MLPIMKNLVDSNQLREFGHVMPERSLPSPAKDIGQLANHKENDGTQYDICERYPVDVGRWTNVRVDLGQDRCDETIAYTHLLVCVAWS